MKIPPIASKKRWAHVVRQIELVKAEGVSTAAAAAASAASSSTVCTHLAGDVPVVEALGALKDQRVCLESRVWHIVHEGPAQQALPPRIKHQRWLVLGHCWCGGVASTQRGACAQPHPARLAQHGVNRHHQLAPRRTALAGHPRLPLATTNQVRHVESRMSQVLEYCRSIDE